MYSSASLVRGFWDEEFFAKKPRTTEVPRTKEVHLFWACIINTHVHTVYALKVKHVYVPARNFGSNLEFAVTFCAICVVFDCITL